MSRICPICEKKTGIGRKFKKLMSKYNPTPKKKKYPNLQWVRIAVDEKKAGYRDFAGTRIKACTKCIKTLSKVK